MEGMGCWSVRWSDGDILGWGCDSHWRNLCPMMSGVVAQMLSEGRKNGGDEEES